MGLAHLHYYCISLLSFKLSWVTAGSRSSHTNPLSIRQDYISYYIYPLLSFINLGKIITYQSWIFLSRSTHYFTPIHDFSECVTGIFILVMGDDFIRDSILLDTNKRFYKKISNKILSIVSRSHSLLFIYILNFELQIQYHCCAPNGF